MKRPVEDAWKEFKSKGFVKSLFWNGPQLCCYWRRTFESHRTTSRLSPLESHFLPYYSPWRIMHEYFTKKKIVSFSRYLHFCVFVEPTSFKTCLVIIDITACLSLVSLEPFGRSILVQLKTTISYFFHLNFENWKLVPGQFQFDFGRLVILKWHGFRT